MAHCARRLPEQLLALLRDLPRPLRDSCWCEGTKTESWNRHKLVTWMSSDPVLVSLFLEGAAA